MALSVNGKTCPICHAYLFDEDEVVYCPICGAPHHKDCYLSVGHCGLEKFHGTEDEYSAQKEEIKSAQHQKDEDAPINEDLPQICPRCMKQLEKDANVCPYCGIPLKPGFKVIDIDLFGGVKKDEDIGEGVKAEDAARLIGVNTARYLPKFKRFKNGKKASFNWLAFLLPEGWFFARKMYKQGALVISLLCASSILEFPLAKLASGVVTNNSAEMAQFLAEKVMGGNIAVGLLAFVSLLISIATRIICGIFGDYFYYNSVLEKAKKSQLADNKEEYMLKHGGINLFLTLVGVLIVSYLPRLIYGLFL